MSKVKSLVQLAEQILEDARQLEASIPSPPTFDHDTIADLPDSSQPARMRLINATLELNSLVRGSSGPYGRLLTNTYRVKHITMLRQELC